MNAERIRPLTRRVEHRINPLTKMALKQHTDSGSDDSSCSALSILQGCGLHGGYYDTIQKAAEGVRDIIRALRADLHDPPHDIQCAVLRKLGVEGFTKEGVAPTHQLISQPNVQGDSVG